VAMPDTASILQGGSITANAFANDTIANRGNVTNKIIKYPHNGFFELHPDGKYTFTPTPDFVGTVTIIYEICDDQNRCSRTTITINVLPKAPQPPAVTPLPDTVIVVKGDSLIKGIFETKWAIQPFKDKKTGNGASVGIDSLGNYTYTAAPCFFGTDEFTYQYCDNRTPQNCLTRTIKVVVEKVDHSIKGLKEISIEADFGKTANGNVLLGVPNADKLTVSLVNGQTKNGNFAVDKLGNVSFTPRAGFSGKDSITLQVCRNDIYAACTPCDTLKVLVKIKEKEDFIPNGFSPDGDGVNDTFVLPPNIGVTFRVYNRWGNIVYENEQYDNTWDGRANRGVVFGERLPDGTYFYTLEYKDGRRYARYLTLKRQ